MHVLVVRREPQLPQTRPQRGVNPAGYRRRKPPVKPKLGAFIALTDQLLTEDQGRQKKQRHTAKRIFERLRDEHGFTGGITNNPRFLSVTLAWLSPVNTRHQDCRRAKLEVELRMLALLRDQVNVRPRPRQVPSTDRLSTVMFGGQGKTMRNTIQRGKQST
jgi:hypothetical protein